MSDELSGCISDGNLYCTTNIAAPELPLILVLILTVLKPIYVLIDYIDRE